jgi:hypothetical protein
VTELYQTQDPEVVITEIRATGTVTTTGRPFTATSAQIIRIRDGLIVHSRDFADPRIAEEAFDRAFARWADPASQQTLTDLARHALDERRAATRPRPSPRRQEARRPTRRPERKYFPFLSFLLFWPGPGGPGA